MQTEAQVLIDACVNLAYWMRGGVTYRELLYTTPGERDRIASFVERRLETEKKNPYPNY
jgi:hypothetical protein